MKKYRQTNSKCCDWFHLHIQRMQCRIPLLTRYAGILSCDRHLHKYVQLHLFLSLQTKICQQVRCKSTTFTKISIIESSSSPPALPSLMSAQTPMNRDVITQSNTPDWENEGKVAYQHMNTIDLLRSSIILALIPYVPNYCLKHGENTIRFVENYILGRNLTNLLLRQTIFKQFCAGENYCEIQDPLQQLQQTYGIGCILDYVAEASNTTTDTVNHNNIDKHTAAHDKSDNDPYNDNAKSLEQCIHDIAVSASALHKTNSPYVAIKMTALGNVRMFRTISLHIRHIQSLFSKLKDNGDGYISYYDLQLSLEQSSMPIEYQSMLTKYLEASFIEYGNKIKTVDFNTHIDEALWMRIWLPIYDQSNSAFKFSETLELFRIISSALDVRCNNIVDAACCNTSHSVNHDDKNKHTTPTTVGLSSLQLPTSDDLHDFHEMINRIKRLADPILSSAKLSSSGLTKQHVRLLIDAEQTLYQPAIDYATYELQRIYNNADTVAYPIISNTYQMYLTDSFTKLQKNYERSLYHNIHFGCKLVRGAYMEEERYNAIANGVPSPIHSTIEDTHNNYNNAISFLVSRVDHSNDNNNMLQTVASHHKSEVMCATHNVESVEWAIQMMNKIDMQERTQSDLSKNSKSGPGIDDTVAKDYKSKEKLHVTNVTISFAQLYGMKDWMTYTLGGRGYNVYKYVPYGPVSLAIPYLLRRANENSSILKPSSSPPPTTTTTNAKSVGNRKNNSSSMLNDLEMIKRELLNRMKIKLF